MPSRTVDVRHAGGSVHLPMIAAHWRPILFVFLPFALGYFLSYFFRTLNALLAAPLTTELGLDASHLGLMTSVYFLTFAAIQFASADSLKRWLSATSLVPLLSISRVRSSSLASASAIGVSPSPYVSI